MERSPVRTTARRSSSRLTVVRPVRFTSRLAGARDFDEWWLLPISSPGFGRPSFGGGVPQYGPTQAMPAPRRRNPLGLVLLLVIGLTLAALGGLVYQRTERRFLPRLPPTRMTTTKFRRPIPACRLSRYQRRMSKLSSG